ncbi:MAG: NADH-quinone oxidoreductase subunit C [Acidobacteria bacterium]|nr:NADH-quinone oxidoreductase subunit C [Acidobacteriota bacterium]
MTDEKKTPQPEEKPNATPAGDDRPAEAGAPAATPSAAPKATPPDEAAKAKAAAKAKEAAPPKQPWEEKPVPPVHEDAADDPDVAALREGVEGSVEGADRFAGQVTVAVPRGKIVETCRFLKEQRGFAFLVDLTAADWPEREEGRFDLYYWLHRFEDNRRLRLKAVVAEDQTIGTVSAVWKTANWMEREVYDMFGIVFEGHPNLERILTWEGFNGHPLRKDFPIEGIDTGAAIYPDVFPPGGGPETAEEEKEGA